MNMYIVIYRQYNVFMLLNLQKKGDDHQMGRQVMNRQEAVIRQNVILKYLESNEMTYDDLLTVLKTGYGIDIGYKMFAKLLKNQSNWRLTYAFVLCDYLNMQLNELFELKECV